MAKFSLPVDDDTPYGRRRAMSPRYHQKMMAIWDAYVAAGGLTPATTEEIAKWAVANGKYTRRCKDQVGACSRALEHAFWNDYTTDPGGNRVHSMAGVPITMTDEVKAWLDGKGPCPPGLEGMARSSSTSRLKIARCED